ncbi:hypothetical protein DEU56DRAFT_48387 [Suillus clintonianus]|uniref:uncharacterized protein n=1 Tax=Suillus clintonianus TaxID=1904413 RepID=UPI001B869B08|nr:uncharacterized protein DEU56DRAFT_48387 [Suillus clintonianus]KAG2123465.1 hypothetical protein DEU56DRAFT_48387 [Suillus clintonianus]
MHPCLHLEEILQEIFKSADYRSLTILARTCRLFYEPALNDIYSDLPGLQPLIERLPRDLWSTRSGTLVVRGPLRPEDWEIFASYSRRVRSIRLRWFASDVGLYRALSSPPDPSFLLPNLRTLTWHCLSARSAGLDVMIAFMGLLLGHNPAEAQLIVSEHALAAFSDLGCTSLKKLVIQNHKVAISPNVTEDAICKLSALRSLTCGEVSIRALHHLAQFPLLSRLSIGLGDDIPSAFTFSRSPFCKLRYLTINTKTVGPCLSMLKATNWNIRCFHHRMDAGYDPAGRKALLDLLPLQLPHKSLKCISLHTNAAPHEDDDLITNPLSLKPLFSFKNLLILELSGAILPGLDNDGLQKLTVAWPQLRVLILQQKAGPYHIPQVDLTGLVLLLEHCPDLYQLALSVNAIIDTKAPPAPPMSSISNKLITSINFCNSPITRTAEVAAFLSAIVPNLREALSWTGEVVCPGGSVPDYRRRWGDVAELVCVFAEVRKQERESCAHSREK